MNNGSSSQPSPELPLPVESGNQLPPQEAQTGDSERDVLTRENLTPQGPATPMPMVDPSQYAAPTAPAGADPASTPAQVPAASVHTPADDTDVIEKEWVNRAKSIVNATSTNPREESKHLNALKAEYIKKRFGKDLSQAKETA